MRSITFGKNAKTLLIGFSFEIKNDWIKEFRKF